jgi:hypothetical protein
MDQFRAAVTHNPFRMIDQIQTKRPSRQRRGGLFYAPFGFAATVLLQFSRSIKNGKPSDSSSISLWRPLGCFGNSLNIPSKVKEFPEPKRHHYALK